MLVSNRTQLFAIYCNHSGDGKQRNIMAVKQYDFGQKSTYWLQNMIGVKEVSDHTHDP